MIEEIRNIQKKIICQKLLLVLCFAVIVFIYMACLFITEQNKHFAMWQGDYKWRSFVAGYLILTAAGVLLAFSCRFMEEGKKSKGIWFGIFSLFIFSLYSRGNSMRFYYSIKELLVALWPGIMLCAALTVESKYPYATMKKIRTVNLIYYMLAFFSIWLLEDRLIPWELYKKDPLEVFYLLVMSCIILMSVQLKHSQKLRVYRRHYPFLWGFLPGVGLLLLLFLRHKRIAHILVSLTKPWTQKDAAGQEVNWLGYRIEAAMGNWNKEYTLLKEFQYGLPYECPLAWIYFLGGVFLLLTVLALEMLLFYVMYRLLQKKKVCDFRARLSQLLLFSFCLRSLLGAFADLFLITSSDVGMLFLRTPFDVIPFCLFLFYASPNLKEVKNNL